MHDGLKKLLEFENNTDILKYRFQYSHLLIWPFARYFFFEEACKQQFEQTESVEETHNRKISVREKLLGKWKQFIWAMESKPPKMKKDIVFLCHNGSNVLREDGKVYNRIFDEYALIYAQDTVMIETPVEGYSSKNRVVPSVISSRYMEYLIWLRVKMSKQDIKDAEVIDEFLENMKNHFPVSLSERFYCDLRTQLLEQAMKIKYLDIYFRRLMKSISPKLVFVEDGCYGLDKAYKIWILHDLGIPVREIQHGLVTPSHVAYNYSEKICESVEYLKFFPDIFYTFGCFWNNSIRIPVPVQVLGNANFSMNIANENFMKHEIKNRILIALTDHAQPFVELLRYILPVLSADYSIIIKTHPKDTHLQTDFTEFLQYKNCKVCNQGNIFDYIAEAEFVVSDYSTTLYEAAGCGKKVLVSRCKQAEWFIAEQIGMWYNSPNEFLDIIMNHSFHEGYMNQTDYIFDHRWKENYKRIIGEL